MEKHQEEKIPVSGFFIGFIFGVAAVLLLKSKQGRRILRTIIESGVDKFGNVEEVIRNSIEIDDDLIESEDYIAPNTQGETIKQENKIKKEKTELIEDLKTGVNEVKDDLVNNKSASAENVTTVKSATRRFFRGIKKRS